MAEYYPLLSKAVGSLPNSTADSRRVVYERARKALIGQLRTLHPPVADTDIERESLELDRAIEKLENELAAAASKPTNGAVAPVVPPPSPATAPPPAENGGGLEAPARKPVTALRPRVPVAKAPTPPASTPKAPTANGAPALAGATADAATAVAAPAAADVALRDAVPPDAAPVAEPTVPAAGPEQAKPPKIVLGEPAAKPRLEAQRPIAPQPLVAPGPKRRLWIIPAGLGAVVLLVAAAAWELRDRPEIVIQKKPVVQAQTESGKIAERVGGPPDTDTTATKEPETAPVKPPPKEATTSPPASQQLAPQRPTSQQPASQQAETTDQAQPQATQAPSNPELPVAHRAALLIEAPDEPNKVKTFLGTVVWKLNNISDGPSDAVGLGVEADIDLPDDKMKVVVTFEKNTDASLPASHTIKVRFILQPGSFSGDVKQISVPQMRREDSPSGEPMAGVTVPVIQDSFLVGLSPGNAETANLQLINGQQWIDIPMLLTNGKIAKLTFEKGDSGQRDIAEALASWQKM